MNFQEAVCDNLAYCAGTRSIVLFLEEIEHRQRGCTGYRVAAVGSAEGTRSWSIHDFCSSNYSADRHTCPHRLGHNQQVWFNALVFNREHSSGAAEAALNLVGNKQDAIALADLLEGLQEAGGCDHETTLALYWLDDDRCYLIWCDISDKHALKFLDAVLGSCLR